MLISRLSRPGLILTHLVDATLVLSLCTLAGCGVYGRVSATAPPIAATALTVSSNPSGSITNAQAITVTVTASAATLLEQPSGTVVLSSGSYASLPTPLLGGVAVITVPAALLPLGADTVTAAYTPVSGSPAAEISATTTLTVASANLPTPVVTATPTTYTTAANPFRAIQTSTGDVLVSYGSGIEVFTPTTGGAFQLSCNNTLSASFLADDDHVFGINLFPHGNLLAAAIDDDGALFYSNLPSLISCNDTGVQVSQGPLSADEGSFDVVITPDDKYAFVANEYGVASGSTLQGNVGVVSLQYDGDGNITSGTLVGQIATAGSTIAGVTLSHDGTRLYVTDEFASTPAANPGANNPVLTKNTCVQQAGSTPMANGLLTVMNVAAAEATPGPAAVIATVNAGCSPVRTVETADGDTLWVSARGDNNVLAFSTGMLELNPGNALLGYASTGGTSPVGLQLFDNDKLLAVANSNRFTSKGSGTTNATIMSVAVPSEASVVQTIPSESFPREITLGQDGSTLFLTNYKSSSMEVIATAVQ